MRSLVTAEELTRPVLDTLFARADTMRRMAEDPNGRYQLAQIGKYRRALNVFAQPSSRTYLSFEAAQALLGMDRMNVRDLSTSSAVKGESLADTIRTFLTTCDLFVLRHPDDQAIHVAREIGEARGVPVVNAGSGTREHPTQALLDLYTIVRERGGVAGRYVLAGDLKRGRTVRSLARLLALYPDVELVLAAPDRLQIDDDVLAVLDTAGVSWRQTDSLEVDADVVYLTRVQDEWDGGLDHPPTDPRFIFTLDHLGRLPASSIVLHPLPKRDEVSPEVCDSGDERLAWWRQVENGIWVRAALVEHLLV